VAFSIEPAQAPRTDPPSPETNRPAVTIPEATAQPMKVNTPLKFALKNLDASHPYMIERGFTPETVAHFGLGYCAKGIMASRIPIPIHNERGELVAYA
jgi:DNA primase